MSFYEQTMPEERELVLLVLNDQRARAKAVELAHAGLLGSTGAMVCAGIVAASLESAIGTTSVRWRVVSAALGEMLAEEVAEHVAVDQ